MCSFPFEENRGIGFRLKEDNKNKDEAGNDQGNPFHPAPSDVGILTDEAANNRT